MTVGLRVLAALAIGCGAGLLAGPVPARASAPSCVAVVVDGTGVTARCTTWKAGLTGLGALSATGHSYRFAPSGLICAVDGFPADCHVDATHYWSYWHRPAGSTSWTYSNEGGGTYRPAPNSTDGWAYQSGTSRQPSNIPFATICPATRPSPSPSPSPLPSPSPTMRPSAPPTAAPPTSPATERPSATRHTSAPAVAAISSGTSSTGGPAAGGTQPYGSAGSPGGGRPRIAAGRRRVAEAAAHVGPAPGASGAAPSSGAGAAVLGASTGLTRQPGAPIRPMLLAGLGVVAAVGLGTAAWRRNRHG